MAKQSGQDHNRQKKAAVINDFTDFGRCSLAVAAPILSAMKVQCCAVPTAIFTNHTGFEHFSWRDCTDRLDDYIRDWRATGLRFDAIASGFLGSARQVKFVRRFIDAFRTPKTLVVVDPVMGDYGKLYPTYDRNLAESMRELMSVADVLTPNLTEACVLANREYDPEIGDEGLEGLCSALAAPRSARIVVSGIRRGDTIFNCVYKRGSRIEMIGTKAVGPDRSGTGDVFSAVIVGDLVRGTDFADAVRHAADFVRHAMERTVEMDLPVTDGLAVEEVLGDLAARQPQWK